jgi:hypothetical protein
VMNRSRRTPQSAEAEDFTSKIERLVKMESNHISPEHKPRRENLDRVVRGTDSVIRSRHLRM